MKILFKGALAALILISSHAQATDFSRLYNKVKHSVVTLQTNEYVEKETQKGIISSQEKGLGSGVLLNKGFILTASHVVHLADRIEVQLLDGRSFVAKPVSTLQVADLALIKIIDAPKDLPRAKLANSDKTDIGEEVIVIGAPYGLSQTLTTGNLSSRRVTNRSDKDNGKTPFEIEFLQTDAPINRGNSGGPMFNTKGEVIGIVSHIRSTSGGNEGLGFAASSNMARRELLEKPPIWSGMDYVPLNDKLSHALNSPYGTGLLVQRVAYGSLGDHLGVQGGTFETKILDESIMIGGDIIVGIGGEPITIDAGGFKRAQQYLDSVKIGEDFNITVYRAGREVELSAERKKLDF